MSPVETAVLWLHIAAGVAAVLAGLGALATRKGGRRHRRAGRVFVAAMGLVVGTVPVLAALDPTTIRLVLLLVAVFSGYLAFSGYRALARTAPAAVDWAAAVVVVLACLALGGWGVRWLLDGRTFGVVMAVFAGIGVWFGGADLSGFATGRPDVRVVGHLQRMLGAFIATVSAVSAVNLTPTLGVVAWLWPTVAGVPLIVYWSRAYGA